jgi:hypothetical protein
MAGEVVASMECDWRKVLADLTGPIPQGRAIWYQKHMWHHMVGDIGAADMGGFTHAFLIRRPRDVIASYLAKRERVTLEDLGLAKQARFFDGECQRLGYAPPVIDAGDVLADPERTLGRLCGALGIDWGPAMLHWQAGRHATDGIWASHWYARVEASTGFEAPNSSTPALDAEAESLALACEPYYAALAAHRL